MVFTPSLYIYLPSTTQTRHHLYRSTHFSRTPYLYSYGYSISPSLVPSATTCPKNQHRVPFSILCSSHVYILHPLPPFLIYLTEHLITAKINPTNPFGREIKPLNPHVSYQRTDNNQKSIISFHSILFSRRIKSLAPPDFSNKTDPKTPPLVPRSTY